MDNKDFFKITNEYIGDKKLLSNLFDIFQNLYNKDNIQKIIKVINKDNNEKYSINNILKLISEDELTNGDINIEESYNTLNTLMNLIEDNHNKLITIQFPNNRILSINIFNGNYIEDLKTLKNEILFAIDNYDLILTPIIVITRELTQLTIENKKINKLRGYFISIDKKKSIEPNRLKLMISQTFVEYQKNYHFIYTNDDNDY